MPRRARWQSWFTALALGSLACAHAPPAASGEADTPVATRERAVKWLDGRLLTRDEFDMMREWINLPERPSASSQGPASGQWPQMPVHWNREAPVALSEAKVNALLGAPPSVVVTGYVVTVMLSTDWRSMPNHWLTRVRLMDASLRDGADQPIALKRIPGGTLFFFASEWGWVMLVRTSISDENESQNTRQKWTGTARLAVSLPVDFQVLAFTPQEVGRTKGGVTLVSWQGPEVVLEGETLDGDLVARGSEGARLAEQEQREERLGQWAYLQGLVKQPWEALPERLETPGERRMRRTVRLAGLPTALEFHRVERRVEREMTVPLVPDQEGLSRTDTP